MGKLTAREVVSIKEPGRYHDGAGLMLVARASGAKSWIVRVQANGRRRDVGLGSLKDVSLSEAREAASETRKQFRQGRDPIAARRDSRRILAAPVTFRDEALAFHAERKDTWRNTKHQAQWLSSMERFVFPHIGSTPIEAVTGPEVRELLVPIWQEKSETARRVLQRTAAVLDFAHARGLREQEAPVRSIRAGLGRQNRRARHFKALPYKRVPNLFAALQNEAATAGRLALLFVILTAARSGEVRNATWSEIDFDTSTWCIPAERMKAQIQHSIPLSKPALTILETAQKLRLTGKPTEMIFPGKRHEALSDMTLTKALRSSLDENFTVHGFRSSFRDWAAEQTTYPIPAVETALAHTIKNKTEAAYHRTDYLEIRRKMMAERAEHLLSQ